MPLKRKLPRESSSVQESPYSKRSRRAKPNQTELAERILENIKSHQKDDGTLLASTFTKVPSKRQNPEYHEAVHEPIDLTRITQRMRMDEYRDIESLTADIDLLVNNTKKYYESDSAEFKDAVKLWELFIDTKAAVISSEASDEPSVTSAQETDDLNSKLDDIYNSLLAEVDDEGQGLTDMFMVLPDEQDYPDYYQKIKEPIDLTMIGEKILKKEYKTLLDFEKDVKQLIKNARNYNEPNSKIYNNANALKVVLQDRMQIESEKVEKSEPGVKTSARLKQRISAKFDGDGSLRRQDAIDLTESSIRGNRGTLLVQASITETTLQDNIDIQAKLYNEIVNYRNALGHSISDAFVRLPNKHQHPAYYEEIQNPISFRTIRRNILNKKYENLEALEEDFTLLFDNAKQYNKEKSQIYKNAQTLCNLMKEKLPHYIKLEEEIDGSDEVSDSDKEDGDGSAEGSDGDSKQKSIKPRISALKEKPQDSFRRILKSLYNAILDGQYEDSDDKKSGRDMISLFMEKPSRKDYPDYYKLILEPIDMKSIGKKIKQDKYPSVSTLVEDFNLMFTNARHYNEPGSEVYEDAERLQEILKKKLEDLPPHSLSEGSHTVKSEIAIQTSNTTLKNMEIVYNKVRDYKDVTGREICEIFNRLPSKHELPDYYQVIKKPMENDRILQKMQANSYATMSEFMSDMLLMFENACTYNEPGSLIYKDALLLQKVAVDTCNEVVGPVKAPDVQAQVQELLTNLFVSVINYQDEDGRCYSDSLTLEIPTKEGKQQNPDGEPMETDNGNAAPATHAQPSPDDITINTIRRNLHARRYRRMDVFQEHMFHVFESVRKRNRTDCEVYEDAVELHKFFIRIRDELCKNGEILMTPALSYTVKHLQADLDAEKQEKLPGETLEDEAGKDEGKEMREKVERSTAEIGINVEGVTYQPGDFVYVEDTTDTGTSKPPHIVCIEKLYQDESGDQMLYGVWFYRPQDTYHVPTRKFLMKEVFKSDYYNTVKLSCIKGKCFVMIGKDYFKMKPIGYIEDDVYVCVSRYSSRMKSFKQIKVLSLPTNNTKIVQREKSLMPVRVLSVYAEKGQDVADAPKLSDMHGPLVKDNIPWPKTVINKKRPNIKIESPQDKQALPGTAQQTYYLQVHINNLCLKVGDNVYVQQNGSDKRLKIARIESMWSDANGTMWFQGSWFAQPCEINHEPTRMFYRNEAFLLSFNTMQNDELVSTNPPPTPLSWVVNVCSVLSVREMMQCRMTEILEQHVHVCESRYLVTDQHIKKIKGSLKKPVISHKVVDDEYYYFKKSFEIPREVSPQLVAAVRQELAERQLELQREQEEENRRKALEAAQSQAANVVTAQPPPQYPQQINPIIQPGAPRPYAVQQYQNQYQQVPFPPQQLVPQPQPYLQPHVSGQQQYIVQHHQTIPPQPQPHYPQQYQPSTPYTHIPQIVQQPSPAGTPIANQAQMQQPYQQQYQQPQPGITHVAQSPMPSGMRMSSTPVDRTDTPGSTSTPTPTTTKKKVRGGHSTGYILFASECHPRMRAEHPSMPFGEISKLVGEEWRNQTDEKKREYEERARELTAKAEAEGRPMQGKKKKKQQMKREMEEAAAAAQQQQQQQQQQLQLQQAQQHAQPQQHIVMQGQQVAHSGVQQPPFHTGQYPVTQAGYQQHAIPVTPQHIAQQQYPQLTPQMVATPVAVHSSQSQPHQPGYATPVNTSQVEQGGHHQAGTGMRRGALFVKPPPKVQRVLHSEAYLRYIEGLEKGQTTISNFEKTLSVEEKDVNLTPAELAKLPTHWLANGVGQHKTVKAALWNLRDLMLKDALAIKNHVS